MLIGASLAPATWTFASETFETAALVENPVALALPEAAVLFTGVVVGADAAVCAGEELLGTLLVVTLLGALCALAVPEAAVDAPPTATEFELVFWVDTAPFPPPVVTWLDCVLEMLACDWPAAACASPLVALETTAGATTAGGGWTCAPVDPPLDELPPGGGVGNGWLPPVDGLPVGNGWLPPVDGLPVGNGWLPPVDGLPVGNGWLPPVDAGAGLGLGLLAGGGLAAAAAGDELALVAWAALAGAPVAGLDATAGLDALVADGLAAAAGGGRATVAAAPELVVTAAGLTLLAALVAVAGCEAAGAFEVDEVAAVPPGADLVVDDAVAADALCAAPLFDDVDATLETVCAAAEAF
jgi:hypothetical protein